MMISTPKGQNRGSSLKFEDGKRTKAIRIKASGLDYTRASTKILYIIL